jgi:hypothetical protein
MKFSSYFLAALAISASSMCQASNNTAPTRKADDGCTWRSHTVKELGVSIFYEDCKAAEAHYELSVKGNVLEQHRPSDDVTFGSHVVLEVYETRDKERLSISFPQKSVKIAIFKKERVHRLVGSSVLKSCQRSHMKKKSSISSTRTIPKEGFPMTISAESTGSGQKVKLILNTIPSSPKRDTFMLS